jgi:hypothetical protein
VIFAPNIADRDDQDKVHPLVVHVKHLDWKDQEWGQLQAYICRGCGFTELYTAHANEIPIDRIPGAKLLRPRPKG